MENVNAQVFDPKGKATGKVDLPGTIFNLEWNGDLVHQVMHGMMANRRQSGAHTKTRGEVSGTGKKPWRQKGTGNARHGSRRSPIWVGGGIAHGPRSDKDYSQKLNRKMKKKALNVALSQKLRDNQVLFVDGFTPEAPSTKTANEMFTALAGVEGFETLNTLKNANNVMFVIAGDTTDAVKQSVRNLPHVTYTQARNLNVLDIVNHRYVVVLGPEAFVESLQASPATTA